MKSYIENTIKIIMVFILVLSFAYCKNKSDKNANKEDLKKDDKKEQIKESNDEQIPDSSKYTLEQYYNMQKTSSPSLSADDKKIIYNSNKTNTNQVYIMDLQSGEKKQLTDYKEPVGSARFSPTDPNLIAFTMDEGGNERSQIFLFDIKENKAINITKDPKSIYYFGDWSLDGEKIAFSSNKRNPQYFDIYEYNIKDKKTTLLHKGDGYFFVSAYSIDGKSLIIGEALNNFNFNLYLIKDLSDPKADLLTQHEGNVRYSATRFDLSEKEMFMVTDFESEFTSIVKFNFETKEIKKDFIKIEHDVNSLGYSKDNKLMFYITNESGYSSMYVNDSDHNDPSKFRRLKIDQITSINGINFSKDRKFMIMSLSHSGNVTDVHKYNFENDTITQLIQSDTNGIDPRTFVKPMLVKYKTFDDRMIDAYLYLPLKKSEKKLPCIVYAHGGPESQFRPFLYASFQYLISKGYAVFASNIRGSTGYGKTFAHLDDRHKREDSIKDIVYGVNWLKESGHVDPNKIVIKGGSYGGYVVMACLTLYPDLWAAGVNSVGIVNFVTFLEKTGPYRRHLREAEYGYLKTDMDLLKRISPINKVDKIKAPLMVIHGVNDPRVPIDEAKQIIKSIEDRNGIVEALIYEDEGHGIGKRHNRIEAMQKQLKFLDKYVKNKS